MPRRNSTVNENVWLFLALARILLGLAFLWAFFDKLLGLGHATLPDKSWLNGGSPTYGFLSHAQGPFAGFFHLLAGLAVSDWLFMLGMIGIGLALTLGIGIKIAAWSGGILTVMMWAASLPIMANPVIDEHLVYMALLGVIGYGLPQQRLSLAGWWQGLRPVKSHKWLW